MAKKQSKNAVPPKKAPEWTPEEAPERLAKYELMLHELCMLYEKQNKLLASALVMGNIDNLRKCESLALHAKIQNAAQDAKEQAALGEKLLGAIFDRQRKAVLPQLMEEQEITTTTISGVGRLTINSDLFVSVVKTGSAVVPALTEEGVEIEGQTVEVDYREWLGRHGLGDLITETINAGSLKSAIKRKIAAGIEVPTTLFKQTPNTYVSITAK